MPNVSGGQATQDRDVASMNRPGEHTTQAGAPSKVSRSLSHQSGGPPTMVWHRPICTLSTAYLPRTTTRSAA